jgi:hypothetical protein
MKDVMREYLPCIVSIYFTSTMSLFCCKRHHPTILRTHAKLFFNDSTPLLYVCVVVEVNSTFVTGTGQQSAVIKQLVTATGLQSAVIRHGNRTAISCHPASTSHSLANAGCFSLTTTHH